MFHSSLRQDNVQKTLRQTWSLSLKHNRSADKAQSSSVTGAGNHVSVLTRFSNHNTVTVSDVKASKG
eukprot:1800651-Rhodomonas_salina.2